MNFITRGILIVGILAWAATNFTQSAFASDEPTLRERCRIMLTELTKVNLTGSRLQEQVAIDFLYSTPEVQDHLVVMGIPWFSRKTANARTRSSLIYDYLEQVMAAITEDNPHFDAAQERELNEQLDRHGAPQGPEYGYGYKRLAKISRDNLLRILGRQKIDQYPGILSKLSREARYLVENFEFDLNHSTNHIHQGNAENFNSVPIFSAKLLLSMGFGDYSGVNTLRFNKEILKSHGQVFFAVNYKAPGSEGPAYTEFGTMKLGVRPDYAHNKGWISAYAMYRDNVKNAARQLPEYPQLRDEESMIPYLHRFDFTFSDLNTLHRVQLAHMLRELRYKSRKEYKQALRSLRSNLYARETVQQLIRDPLRLPERFEFKIPLAAPPGTIRVYPPATRPR